MLKEFVIDNPARLHPNDAVQKSLNFEVTGDFVSMNEGVVILNESCKVVNLNNSFRRLTGPAVTNCLGADIRQLPNLGSIPDLVHKEIAAKKRSANFMQCINGRELLVIGNYIPSNPCKSAEISLVFIDLIKLKELVLNYETVKETVPEECTEVVNIANHDGIITRSATMKRIFGVALRVAKVDSSVLVTGETGVGKEILAKFIHQHSSRTEGPFIKINCSAIPENLIESELFGYESGAFTGAKREGKPGLIEMANGGTLFLDEIGDLPFSLQVKILRVLQEREIQRVGGIKVKKVDFRLIAATNKNLEDMVKQQEFREDLFYRLNVVPVMIPPLRERREEIVPLTALFLDKYNKKYGISKKISAEVIQSFTSYEWPGNVRELENTIERLVVTSDSNLILMENLTANTGITTEGSNDSGLYLRNTVEDTERHLLLQAIQQCNNTREMATVLGISQSAVVKKMQKHGIAKCKPKHNVFS